VLLLSTVYIGAISKRPTDYTVVAKAYGRILFLATLSRSQHKVPFNSAIYGDQAFPLAGGM